MKHKARSYSDTAPVVAEMKRSAGNKLADPGALITAPTPTEGDKADARAYLERHGCADIVVVLGLVEPPPSGPEAVECSTCGRPIGSSCVMVASGTPWGRTHIARTRLAEKLELERQRQAADVLLDEVLAEAGSAS